MSIVNFQTLPSVIKSSNQPKYQFIRHAKFINFQNKNKAPITSLLPYMHRSNNQLFLSKCYGQSILVLLLHQVMLILGPEKLYICIHTHIYTHTHYKKMPFYQWMLPRELMVVSKFLTDYRRIDEFYRIFKFSQKFGRNNCALK